MSKKIGFLTGGGDCAGINAFIAAAIRKGIEGYGAEFVGIPKAFEGCVAEDIENNLLPLQNVNTLDLRCKASTILASSRFNPFSETNRREEYPQKLLDNLEKIGLDALLVTGGNDTILSAKGLEELGFPVVAAPKSIDNDVSGTDIMLGFKTAVAFGGTAFQSTAVSAQTHGRISVVEIMGREAGWLTLEIGLAGGADIILIPEQIVDLKDLMGRIESVYKKQGYVNIAVAEGMKMKPEDPVLEKTRENSPVVQALLGEDLGKDAHGNPKLGGIGQILRRIIVQELDLKKIEKVRATDLGFTLRGLTPVAEDIMLGTRFGYTAVDLLFAGKSGKMTGLQGNRIVPVPFEEALVQKLVDLDKSDLQNAGVYSMG